MAVEQAGARARRVHERDLLRVQGGEGGGVAARRGGRRWWVDGEGGADRGALEVGDGVWRGGLVGLPGHLVSEG